MSDDNIFGDKIPRIIGYVPDTPLFNMTMKIAIENNSIAYNICAVTGRKYEDVMRECECVGIGATTDKLNALYNRIMAGYSE